MCVPRSPMLSGGTDRPVAGSPPGVRCLARHGRCLARHVRCLTWLPVHRFEPGADGAVLWCGCLTKALLGPPSRRPGRAPDSPPLHSVARTDLEETHRGCYV